MAGIHKAVQTLLTELGAIESAIDRDGRILRISYVTPGRNRPARFIVSTAVDVGGSPNSGRRVLPTQPIVLFRRETWRDRLGKSLGVNEEIELSDFSFDSEVYIETVSPADDVQAVASETSVRAALQTLTKAGAVKLDSNGLSLDCLWSTLPTLDRAYFDSLAQALVTVAAGVPHFTEAAVKPPTRVLPAVLSVIAAVVFMVVSLSLGAAETPIDTRNCVTAFGIGLVVWLGIVLLLSRVVRGDSTAFRRLATYGFLLLFTVPLTVAMLLYWYNSSYDQSSPAVHDTKVARVYYTTDKHGNRTYHAEVDNWRPGQSDRLEPSFSDSAARTARRGEAVRVITGTGKLGWEWMRSYQFGEIQ